MVLGATLGEGLAVVLGATLGEGLAVVLGAVTLALEVDFAMGFFSSSSLLETSSSVSDPKSALSYSDDEYESELQSSLSVTEDPPTSSEYDSFIADKMSASFSGASSSLYWDKISSLITLKIGAACLL